MLHRMFRSHARKRAVDDRGLTLVELLVVIVILGILAAVVVASVNGVGDKGKEAASDTEAEILRTAQEAYCTTNARYGTIQDLKNVGVIERDLGFYGTVPYTVAGQSTASSCNLTDYYVGPTSVYGGGDTGDPLFYSAANNTFPWSFLAPEFVGATGTDGKPLNGAFRVRFDASGVMRADANSATPPVGGVASLFAAADTSNVLAVIPNATASPAGNGTCIAPNTCRGIASTATRYAIGALAMFSCRSEGESLPPADGGSKRCKKPPALTGAQSQYLAAPPTTPAQVVAAINADPLFKIAIPSGGTAPYGVAAQEVLAAAGLVLPHPQVVNVAAGTTSQNVTQTQTQVLDGLVHMAFVPKSFVLSPAGVDTNNWTDIPPTSHTAINQWGVVLETPGSAVGIDTPAETLALRFLQFLTTDFAQQALVNGYGYVRAIP
ncbi:MAG: substrate-binding domain-containing protein [Sporichthyaceae bacterium]